MSLYEFGGTERQVRACQKRFLRYFSDCERVLDIGCGRGVFLELLRQQGTAAEGVDSAPEAIAACQAKGLDNVSEDDTFHYLRDKRRRYDGIFCSHLIEHLDYADAVRLLGLCFDALAPEGTLVIVTPNGMDLQVLGETFWLDPTHKRFYPVPLLQRMLGATGFQVIRTGHFLGGIAGVRKRQLPGFLVRKLLWGPHFGTPNLFVIATKRTFPSSQRKPSGQGEL